MGRGCAEKFTTVVQVKFNSMEGTFVRKLIMIAQVKCNVIGRGLWSENESWLYRSTSRSL